jgi:pimeloyl-ACP methyl ester carboxylesterase
VSDRFVTAATLELAVREQGDHGHALPMIDGLGANVDMWGPAQITLAQFSRTIAFDAPGTGRSETPWLHRIQAPTLVLSGARDKLVPPANGRLIARRLPNAQLELPDSAALPLLTHFFTA